MRPGLESLNGLKESARGATEVEIQDEWLEESVLSRESEHEAQDIESILSLLTDRLHECLNPFLNGDHHPPFTGIEAKLHKLVMEAQDVGEPLREVHQRRGY